MGPWPHTVAALPVSCHYSGGRISYLNSTEYTRSGLDRNSTALSPTLPPRTGARRKSGRQHYAISVEPWPSIPCRIQVGYASSTVVLSRSRSRRLGTFAVSKHRDFFSRLSSLFSGFFRIFFDFFLFFSAKKPIWPCNILHLQPFSLAFFRGFGLRFQPFSLVFTSHFIIN